MRPLYTLAALAAITLSLAACGDSSDSSASSTTLAVVDDAAPGSTKIPEVSLPAELPTELVVTDLTTGTGPAAANGDTVVVHYVGVRSVDGMMFDNSYERNQPYPVTLGLGSVIQGWDEGLIGVQQGTVRQLDIPASMGYGDSGSGDVIRPGDALTFRVEVVAVLPASKATDQPFEALDPTDAVSETVIDQLRAGTGAEVKQGQTLAFHLEAFRADTGELLNTSWGAAPFTTEFSPQSTIDAAFLDAFAGMKIGERRMVQIPATLIFDGAGSERLGLPVGVDLTMVIDLIAAW